MSLLQAIFLGIIQGLTEFLPVSSSGHLAILQNIFDIETQGGILFDVLLHLGTLMAVVLVFWTDIKMLLLETLRIIYDLYGNLRVFILNKQQGTNEAYRRIIYNNYRKFVVLVIVSTIPTAMLGFASRHLVEAAGNSLVAPGIGLLITGVLLLVVDYSKSGKKIPKDTTYADAMWIGICQGIAVFPGISRSGTTITASLFCGLNRKFAVKYSFIMSIPAIVGAALLEIGDLGSSHVSLQSGMFYIIGAIVAGVVGFFAIKFMIKIVQRKKFRYFAYYCFLIGMVSIVGSFFK